ncbi:MAG: hypothetical protein HY381_02725 [Candidatus Chisholmbacteria bacterium]|nr:hypothetical protein [Candidatus Chisholmbacteria bacterium]
MTHINPDLDAMMAVWILKHFHPEFRDAKVEFIYAGSTYKDEVVDANPQVVHVDTGWGRFDHHQTGERTCASKLVFDWVKQVKPTVGSDEALMRMIEVVLQVDWGAADLRYPKAGDDRYAFLFNERKIISGWQKRYPNQSSKHLEWGLVVLDGVYENLRAKVAAQKVLAEAVRFKTQWGEGVGAETNVFGFMPLAQTQGFAVVVLKDKKKGHVRIHGLDQAGQEPVDFSKITEVLKGKDPQATWFLHASKKLLLNGSTVNPKMVPTKLGLMQVVEVVKSG